MMQVLVFCIPGDGVPALLPFSRDSSLQRSSSLAGCPMAEAALPKPLLQNFSSPFLRITLANQCQHLVTQMASKLLQVSHLQKR